MTSMWLPSPASLLAAHSPHPLPHHLHPHSHPYHHPQQPPPSVAPAAFAQLVPTASPSLVALPPQRPVFHSNAVAHSHTLLSAGAPAIERSAMTVSSLVSGEAASRSHTLSHSRSRSHSQIQGHHHLRAAAVTSTSSAMSNRMVITKGTNSSITDANAHNTNAINTNNNKNTTTVLRPQRHGKGRQATQQTAPPGTGGSVAASGKKVYHCPIPGCKQTSSNKGNLSKHIATRHEHRKDYECPFDDCSRRFAKKYNMLRHLSASGVHRPLHKRSVAMRAHGAVSSRSRWSSMELDLAQFLARQCRWNGQHHGHGRRMNVKAG